MSLWNNTLQFIEQGKKGYNEGLPFTLNKLSKWIKIWKGRYYLYFAYSGVGKSKFVYDQHLFNVIDQQIQHHNLDTLIIDLYSLEISPISVMGNMLVQYLQKYKGIITDLDQIFSYDKLINPELNKIIKSKEVNEYLKEVEKYLNIETHLSFNSLIKNTNDKLKQSGKLITEGKRITEFIPNSNEFLYQIIIDHISLTDLIPQHNRYETIGIISRYLFAIRELAKVTPVIIQQAKPERNSKPEEQVSPSHENLRDSPETYNDADVAIAIGNPFKHGLSVYPDYKGYKILPSTTESNSLKDRFRFLEIRKNRYGGGENRIIPAIFTGETNHYANIPVPKEMTKELYLKISNINKTFKNE